MRVLAKVGGIAVAAGVLLATAASAAGPVTVDGPARRAGLWVSTMTGGSMGAGMKIESCVAAGQGKDGSIFTQNRAMAGCGAAPVITRIPGGASMHMTCTPTSGMTMSTTAVATGDFSSRYRVHTTTTITSSRANMPAMAPVTADVDIVYAGACPADLKPGDTRSGGRVFHTPPK